MKLGIRISSILAIATLSISLLATKATSSQSHVSAFLLAQANSTTASTNNIDLNRAKNIARRAAEVANGGLNNYRAESSMHGIAEQSPFVDNGNGTWTFTFKGKKPNSPTFSIETVVTVSQDGKQYRVDYNGPIRGQEKTESP